MNCHISPRPHSVYETALSIDQAYLEPSIKVSCSSRHRITMIGRSRPTTRRFNPRGHSDTPRSSRRVKEEQNLTDQTLPLRSKRSRIASVSDPQRLNKKVKTENNHVLPATAIALRNRSLPGGTKPNRVVNNTEVVSLPPTPQAAISNGKPQSKSPTLPKKKTAVRRISLPASQPSRVAEQNDQRKLRSQDGVSRSKSELAMYFNNYEQMLSLEPVQQGKSMQAVPSDSINFRRTFDCQNTNHDY